MTVDRQTIHTIFGSDFEILVEMREDRKVKLKIPVMGSADDYENVPVGQNY